MSERELCQDCGGNGVVKIPGGISVCGRCHGECWEPTSDALRSAEARIRELEQRDPLSVPQVAGLCAFLKSECEKQHARAERAEARIRQLEAALWPVRERVGLLASHGRFICDEFAPRPRPIPGCRWCGYTADVHLLRDVVAAFDSAASSAGEA